MMAIRNTIKLILICGAIILFFAILTHALNHYGIYYPEIVLTLIYFTAIAALYLGMAALAYLAFLIIKWLFRRS